MDMVTNRVECPNHFIDVMEKKCLKNSLFLETKVMKLYW